jgi:Protein of unknown function (DUF3365)
MTQLSRVVTLFVIGIVYSGGPALSQEAAQSKPSPETLAGEGRTIIKGFAGELMTTLQSSIKEGGLAGGMAACNVAAPVIASEAAKKSGWSVGRTALKVRNQANAPDAFERQALEEFLADAKSGADLAKLERGEIVTVDGKATFRFMKAIPVVEACLACHGANLKPEAAQAINQLYPADQATGFAVGDLRGAFTLKRVIE